MRRLLIISVVGSLAGSLAACELYFDQNASPGALSPESSGYPADAHLPILDGGGFSDGGRPCRHPVHLDGGIVCPDLDGGTGLGDAGPLLDGGIVHGDAGPLLDGGGPRGDAGPPPDAR